MITRETNRYSIAWVRDQFKLKNLDLDPPYQRRSVWNTAFQQFFIDSILRNFPVPPIFVAEEVTSEGRTIYHVIDGKQRLTAILEFLDDVYPVGKRSEVTLQKKYYSELDQDWKKHILSYRLHFESLSLTTDNITIDEIYDRFNRNVARLNEQELRKAKYQGMFSRKMESLADSLASDTFWMSLKLFTPSAVRRMQDVEYISELYTLTMDGEQEPDMLDDYYAKYDDETATLPQDVDELFDKIKQTIKAIGLDFEATRFSNLGDFYSLWAAVRSSILNNEKLNNSRTKARLTDFSNQVNAAAPSYKGDVTPGEDAKRYSEVARQGANKKANRELRAQIIRRHFVASKSK